MGVKRLDASHFAVAEGSGITAEEAADHDFLIRSGKCPNRCGAMTITTSPYIGQECPECKFWCNSLPDRGAAN
jgi:hypothetical protein